MKRSILNLTIVTLSITSIPFQVSCNGQDEKTTSQKTIVSVYDSTKTVIKTSPNKDTLRESITFILGEDKKTGNPYYGEATYYYLYNERGKTNYTVTTCRSLLEVRNYLVDKSPSNKRPWGTINLVSHGDQWLGLSVKVTPDSKRSTLERVLEYYNKGTFKPLPDNVVDNQSEILIHACGVGNNPELIEAIRKVFRGIYTAPVIRAPRLFEFYSSAKDGGFVKESQKYHTNVWMTQYKKGEKPKNKVLCNMLQEKYPDCTVDWLNALNRDHPRWAGDIYHYTFDVPVSIIIKCSYTDSIINLSSEQEKLTWIKTNPEIMETLKKTEIPAENFNWNLTKIYLNNKGKKSPAIMVKGYCTILCILKPLLEDSKNMSRLQKPFVPALNDTAYYYTLNN